MAQTKKETNIQTDRETDKHRDSITESARWGRFSETLPGGLMRGAPQPHIPNFWVAIYG